MSGFFVWMLGKPVPLWGQVVIGIWMLIALYHWSCLIRWFVEWWKEESRRENGEGQGEG